MFQEFFNLLMNARIEDTEGEELTDIAEIRFSRNRLVIVLEAGEEDEGDPDDGEEQDFEEPSSKIHAISGGKK